MRSASQLVPPTAEYADSYRALVAEFNAANEGLIPFTLGFANEDFADYLRRLELCAQGMGPAAGFVPHSTWWLVSDGDVVAVSNLRHHATAALLREGGHIGYGVRPSSRGRGFGREVLRYTLQRARAIGLHNVLLTCRSDNVASIRTILANAGTFDSEAYIEERGTTIHRYVIDLTT